LVAAGVLLFISNPLQEHLEWLSYARGGQRSVFSLVIEEGSELFGTLCFLTAAVLYAVHTTRILPKDARQPAISVAFSVNGKTVLSLLLLGLGGMAVMLVVLQLTFGEITDIQIGIPKNWMPSAVAFAGALLSIYLAVNTKWNTKRKRLLLLLSAAFAMVVSVYYGSNMYASKGSVFGSTLGTFVLAALAVTGTGLFLTAKNAWFRLGIIAWTLFTGLAFSTGKNYSAELSFIGFSALLLSLSGYTVRKQLRANAGAESHDLNVVTQLSKVESAA
jgi:hypothetical protein